MSRDFDPEQIKDFVAKYENKLKEELDLEELPNPEFADDEGKDGIHKSREYNQFKSEYMPKHLSYYENMCNFCEKIVKPKLKKKDEIDLKEAIDISHLNITPYGAIAFGTLMPFTIIILGIIIAFMIPTMMGGEPSMFFLSVFMIGALMIWSPLNKLPYFIANSWRLQASNQMVLCIFYIVTYMRQSSNLENAIDFAAEHLGPPLSLDMKKLIWNVESQKYESIAESIDYYLVTWRKWNLEFIESMNLIQSSLFESSNDRRLTLLDKSLEVILEETYEKMLHYAHNLKTPVTTLHMLGVILPILGLVILPLVVSFMGGVMWYHLAVLYNLFLPIVVFLMGKNILAKRPSGYGQTDITKNNPELTKKKNLIINIAGVELVFSPVFVGATIGIIFFIFGIAPLIMHAVGIPDMVLWGSAENPKFLLLEYKTLKDASGNKYVDGPFGFGSAILSLCIPLSLGYGFGMYHRSKSKNIIKIREQSKKLEKEFASAIFQLGNRIGDGIPAEIAFGKVSSIMTGTTSGKFFEVVNMNIQKTGLSVQDAIFHKKYGAINQFPSAMIESSMKILVQATKKGPQVAASAMMNISRYMKEMHAVEERLKDLLSDTISSMQSQIKFMSPVISGIVIGITSMVSSIIGKLGDMIETQSATDAAAGVSSLGDMFHNAVPTYYFQLIVGVYVVQIIYILTILVNGIENGRDDLNETYTLGVNMTKSTMLYVIVSLIIMTVFNFIAVNIMPAVLE